MDETLSPVDEAAWNGFLQVQGLLMRQLDADLQRDHHLSHAEFEVLVRLLIQTDHRLRLSELSARSLLTLSGMSRLVARLEQSGSVRRVEASEDRRGAYAELTDEGKSRVRAAIKTHHADIRRHFLSLYSEQELESMARYWQRFLEREQEQQCRSDDSLLPS